MKNKLENGTGELTTFTILLLICVMIITSFHLVFNIKYLLNKKIIKYDKLEKINLVVNEIEKDFDFLKKDDFDSDFSSGILYIKNKYSMYNFIIKDISSGYNINSLPQEFIISKDFEKLMLIPNNELDVYKQILEKNKFIKSKEKLKNCLSEFGKENISFYGWVNKNFTDCKLFNLIEKKDNKFPVLNSIPLSNIYFLHPDILKIFISNPIFKINNPEEKFEKLQDFINSKNILNKEILIEILEIKKDNKILHILGNKTQFWEILFTIENINVNLIVAGFPKDENSNKIEYYKIIERNIVYEN
ncbi:MAG: hypothetical protein IJD23_01355 [Spirochaetaceae bacterium]|nr:hypothetical protein [Spirochaetaceae bacterium]